MAQQFDLGKVSVTLGGEWASNVLYEKLTIVMRKGEGYVSRESTQNEDPLTFGNKWMKITQKGESLYELMVEEGEFVGTLEEFLQEYEDTLQAARDAAASATQSEQEIAQAEDGRVQAEQSRVQAELLREEAESARNLAESERQGAEAQRIEETNAAIDIATHPDYVGSDNYVYHYNATTQQYEKTSIYVKGVSVQSVEQIETSTESGGRNTIRVTLTNGVVQDFYVTNGQKVVPTVEDETLVF